MTTQNTHNTQYLNGYVHAVSWGACDLCRLLKKFACHIELIRAQIGPCGPRVKLANVNVSV